MEINSNQIKSTVACNCHLIWFCVLDSWKNFHSVFLWFIFAQCVMKVHYEGKKMGQPRQNWLCFWFLHCCLFVCHWRVSNLIPESLRSVIEPFLDSHTSTHKTYLVWCIFSSPWPSTHRQKHGCISTTKQYGRNNSTGQIHTMGLSTDTKGRNYFIPFGNPPGHTHVYTPAHNHTYTETLCLVWCSLFFFC